MKSRTIEIIDNHIKALEEELEWYQKRNAELNKSIIDHKNEIVELHRIPPIKNYVKLKDDNEKLQQENARLREQLRWRSVDELPKKETANCSITVLLDIDYVGVFKVYYNFLSEIWVGVQGKQEYFRAEDFKNTKARWCYIPEDGDA